MKKMEPSGPQKTRPKVIKHSESLKTLPVVQEASNKSFPQSFPRQYSGENLGEAIEADLNQASAYLYLRVEKKSTKTGECPIYLQVAINKAYFKVSLNISVPEVAWDGTRGQVAGRKYQEQINQCNDALGRASRIFQKYNMTGRYLSKEIFLDEFSQRANLNCFQDYFKNKLEERFKLGIIAKPTYIHNKTILNLLRDFRPGGLPFAEISERFVLQFKKWNEDRLQLKAKESNREQVGGGINRIGKILATLKIYIRIAESEGIRVSNPFKNGQIKIRLVKGQRHSLKLEEYRALVQLFDGGSLPSNEQEVLRAFLFSCHTSLAIGDLKEFNRFVDVHDHSIVYIRKKNKRFGQKVSIPLTPGAKKYLPEKAQFIQFPDQHYNDLLKHIMNKAKVETWLTYHVARHTYATMFLASGGQIHVLKELMGHGKIATTEIYITVAEQWKVEQMEQMSKFLRVA
jgi:integrase/recombinase XerD